ncbi:PrgI family protein [Prauserella flavalba]|uniref:PrgI family protein n=1 Tax=Prauserella flavalba TaxID=1477506 RepID=UPI0036EB702E
MTQSVRIPADVDREDRILAGFTARQVAVLAVTALLLYGGWVATRAFLPVIAYLIVAVPVGVAVAVLVIVQRDGLTLDRLLLAAIKQRMNPRRRIAATDAPAVPDWLAEFADDTEEVSTAGLDLPAQGVTEAGVVDLGREGVALVAVASTVNFALRTPAEQDALVSTFGRYLHSLTAPVQIVIRAERLDLSGQIAELRERAASLPHPALEAAALDHADYLDQLDEQTELLRRQILLVVREPLRTAPQDTLTSSRRLFGRARHTDADEVGEPARRAATSRLVRRVNEATELLAPAGITVTPLDARQATTVLATACNPDSAIPPSAEMAGADEVITTPADHDWDTDNVEGS